MNYHGRPRAQIDSDLTRATSLLPRSLVLAVIKEKFGKRKSSTAQLDNEQAEELLKELAKVPGFSSEA